MQGVLVGKR